jgi:hypothetical protein
MLFGNSASKRTSAQAAKYNEIHEEEIQDLSHRLGPHDNDFLDYMNEDDELEMLEYDLIDFEIFDATL